MPKRPSHRHIVRDIRVILGWNQDGLAKRIGSTASAINKIENGAMPISRRLALRLHWATGVSWRDIVKNREGHPRTRFGPLHRDHLDKLQQRARELSDKEFKTIVDNGAYFIELLLRACRRNAPYKLWALDAAILAMYEELVDDFSLKAAVEDVKAEMADESLQSPEIQAEIEHLAAPLKAAIGALIKQTERSPAPGPSKRPRQPVSPGSDSDS